MRACMCVDVLSIIQTPGGPGWCSGAWTAGYDLPYHETGSRSGTQVGWHEGKELEMGRGVGR
jgi:hypothetical protein